MKKKIVIDVQMNCDKCRKKAMKLTASSDGVISVTLGDSKSQLIVTGDDVDSTKLVNILRKKVGYAKIVQLGDAEEKKEKKEEKKEETTTISHWYPPRNYGPPIMFYECSSPGPCSIQ